MGAKIRSQKRVPGKPRKRTSSAVNEAIDRELRATARHFKVSRSFVQAVALADALGIDIDERYDVPADRDIRLVKGSRHARRSA